MHSITLGIDVAKSTLACCLYDGKRRQACTVPNTPKGFLVLLQWLQRHTANPVPLVLEATGGYEEAVATFFFDHGWIVYRVNPLRIKRWAECSLQRTKTDPVDAYIIATFGRIAEKLYPWQPVPPEYRTLQQLVRAREALKKTRQAYLNRKGAPCLVTAAADSFQHLIAALDKEIKVLNVQIRQVIHDNPELKNNYQLLTSIIGIGYDTAVILMGELGDCRQFQHGGQLVAFTGLAVRERQSGTSIHGRPRLSKQGAPQLRKSLYFPAVTAFRCAPQWQAFIARMVANHKTKKQIICALMRKLAELVFAVLRKQQPFTLTYQHPRQQAAVRQDTKLEMISEKATVRIVPLQPTYHDCNSNRAVA